MNKEHQHCLSDGDRQLIVHEALEERRHFRGVHLAVWTVQMTAQLAALAGMLTNPTSVVALRSYVGAGAAVSILAFIAFPAICIFVILHYHYSYYYASCVAADMTEALRDRAMEKTSKAPRVRRHLERGLDVLFGSKYLRTRKPILLVGWGHPMYAVSIAMVAILNVCTFWLLKPPS
jgi:hypothetical protein